MKLLRQITEKMEADAGKVHEMRVNGIPATLEGKRKIGQPVGEAHSRATLTTSQVLEIRTLREEGNTYKTIAEMFDMPYSTVAAIATRATWKHI